MTEKTSPLHSRDPEGDGPRLLRGRSGAVLVLLTIAKVAFLMGPSSDWGDPLVRCCVLEMDMSAA